MKQLKKTRYYLNLDDEGYVLSINTVDLGQDEPSVETIDGLNLSGLRIRAHRFEGGALVFDEARYAKLLAEEEEREKEAQRAANAPSDAELAIVELAELTAQNAARLDEQDAALVELAAMIAGR